MLPACSAPAIRGEHLGSWGGVVRTGRRRVGPTRCANCGDEACRPALWPQIVVRYHRRRDMELSCCKRGQVLVAPGAWRPPVHGGGWGDLAVAMPSKNLTSTSCERCPGSGVMS